MFCPNCGRQIADNAAICVGCGVSVSNAVVKAGVNNEPASFGWAVLGFFFPIVGFILWLVWKSNEPNKAKKAGVGALVGVIVNVVLSIIMAVVGAAFTASLMYYM